jgi:hypothetical protein
MVVNCAMRFATWHRRVEVGPSSGSSLSARKYSRPKAAVFVFSHPVMLKNILRRNPCGHCFVTTGVGFCTVFGSTVISCKRLATSGVIDSW